jgi:lipopolysaccharide/colanic/teichoic acid biosynthesis glycosyltransferase
MSLDELPQLINVFLGNMSLVGPRPEMPFIVERYSVEQRRRLQVLPGITGLWQLSADRAFPIHENMEYDLYYMRNRNFFMDVAILIHTAVFAARGAV